MKMRLIVILAIIIVAATTGTAHAEDESAPTVYIPAGASMKGMLLTGAPLSLDGKKQPVMIRMDHRKFVSAVLHVDGECTVIGEMSASTATERGNIQLAIIFCTDKNEKIHTESSVEGFVADSNKISGIPGTIKDNSRYDLADLMGRCRSFLSKTRDYPALKNYCEKIIEQGMPVLEIKPGTKVNLVFTKGVMMPLAKPFVRE